jgi:DNA polymerase-3 subunit gamma/tau
MSYLVLARKYRPQTFEEVVGQDHVTRTLRNAIRTDRVAHALLFSGPRGVGKTSVARIMAKAMNCGEGPTPSPCNVCQSCKEITGGMSLDVFEIDGASNRGINEIRELRENVKYMPSHSRFKIYIVDEVHMLTTEAFNALLKTLEEPPPHVLFFFATTEAHRIPITILSRCQRHNFKRIGLEDTVTTLKHISQEMSFRIEDKSLALLARAAGGSMRDALSLLDQVMAYSEGTVSEVQVLDSLGALDRQTVFEIAASLLKGDAIAALTLLEEVYDHGYDPKRLYDQIVEHFRHLLIFKMDKGTSSLVDVSAQEAMLMKQQVGKVSFETVHQAFTTLFAAEASVRRSSQPRLALEALFIKLAQFRKVESFDHIISKLDLLAKGLAKGEGIPKQREGFEEPKQEAVGISENKELPYVATEPHEDLAQTWQQLLSVFSDSCPSLMPSLEKALLTKLNEGSLEITVRGNSFYTARLRDEKSMAAMRDICKEVFKRDMKIHIVETPDTASRNDRSKESDRTRRLKKEALRHPMVAEALEVFEGKVVSVRIL